MSKHINKTISYPKPKCFEPDDDSHILIGNRFRGVSAQLGLSRRPVQAKRRRKSESKKQVLG